MQRKCAIAFLNMTMLLVLQSSALSWQRERALHGPEWHLREAQRLDSADDDRAETEYWRAINSRNGKFPEALSQLGVFLSQRLRFSEAAEVWRKYIDQTAAGSATYDLKILGDFRRAAVLQSLVTASPKPRLEDLIELAWLIRRYGRNHHDDAVPYGEKAVALYPESSAAHLLLGEMLPNNHEREREELQKAVELDPYSARAHLSLGQSYFFGKTAIAEYREALRLSGGQLDQAWLGLGRALCRGDLQDSPLEGIEALRTFQRLAKPGDGSLETVAGEINRCQAVVKYREAHKEDK
jgi:tetratricopeptide (TPR) repeat protein